MSRRQSRQCLGLFVVAALSLLVFAAPTCDEKTVFSSPYAPANYRYKGQVHVHTDRSDGQQSPSDVEYAYVVAGYDFICITDHSEGIMPTPKPWGSRLKGILHVLSAEDGYACRHHLLCLGIDLNKAKGHSADGDANGVCDLTTCQCEHLQPRVDYEKEIGALTVIAHPNSGHDDDVWLGVHADCEDGTSLQDLQNTTNYTGIEIFNAGSPTWSDAMWDEAMSYSPGNRTTWCFAADDCHDVALNKKSFNRGWIIVNSDEAKPTQVGVIDAIRSGNFYQTK